MIVTDHSAYRWPWIAEHASLIIDARNAMRGVSTSPGQVVRT
jgi:UDP-N-acetyl-D-glucosamine dehydrogenase